MRFTTDTRGASIPITHALTIAITALLMATLLIGAGNFLGNQQATAARAQLGDVAGDVTDQINTLDRLNHPEKTVTATFDPSYKQRAGGASYSIALITESSPRDTEATLFVNSTALSSPVRIPIETDTAMEQKHVQGDNPTLSLCADGGDQFITVGACP